MQSEEQQSISQNCKIVRCEPLRRLQRVLFGVKIIYSEDRVAAAAVVAAVVDLKKQHHNNKPEGCGGSNIKYCHKRSRNEQKLY